LIYPTTVVIFETPYTSTDFLQVYFDRRFDRTQYNNTFISVYCADSYQRTSADVLSK